MYRADMGSSSSRTGESNFHVLRIVTISLSEANTCLMNYPHEDRPMSPHARPRWLFYMTVLILVLIGLQILIPKDCGPVLVPSLVSGYSP